jgi:hypothetical protein
LREELQSINIGFPGMGPIQFTFSVYIYIYIYIYIYVFVNKSGISRNTDGVVTADNSRWAPLQ